MSQIKAISKYLLATFMIAAGIMHFVNPAFYLKRFINQFKALAISNNSLSLRLA
ncbi:MAG: hypothetical protein WKF77_04875 [Planctomycetaceae bacterium]